MNLPPSNLWRQWLLVLISLLAISLLTAGPTRAQNINIDRFKLADRAIDLLKKYTAAGKEKEKTVLTKPFRDENSTLRRASVR